MINETTGLRTDRVYMDESVMPIYRELRGDATALVEQAPFATHKDMFMLATCLGYRSGSRQRLPSGARADIRETVFTESDLALLKAIAIADTGDVDVLSKPHEILQIAEEYAHSGIWDVKAYLLNERGRPLWNLVSLVIEASEHEPGSSEQADQT